MHSDLTLIILNYNTADLVAQCLDSVKKYHLDVSPVSTTVMVVDNGSHDHSAETIERKFPWVKMIRSEKNLGFAGGNNLALKQVKTTYAMLLNSDTELTVDSNLTGLVEFLDYSDHVAVVTPRVELSDGQLDWASHRGEPTPWAAAFYFSHLAKVFPKSKTFSQYHLTFKDLHKPHEIAACSGAAMMVRMSAVKEVGLLDEAFFMYGEDLDWCHRFRAAGFHVMYLPQARVIHHKYKSGMGHRDEQRARKTRDYFYETMLQYYDKYYRATYPEWARALLKLFIRLKKGAI